MGTLIVPSRLKTELRKVDKGSYVINITIIIKPYYWHSHPCLALSVQRSAACTAQSLVHRLVVFFGESSDVSLSDCLCCKHVIINPLITLEPN